MSAAFVRVTLPRDGGAEGGTTNDISFETRATLGDNQLDGRGGSVTPQSEWPVPGVPPRWL